MLKLFLLVCFTVNALVDSTPLDKPVVEERIIGGKDTDITEVPHQISIALFDFHGVCGGFIVSPNHIITSGVCGSASRLSHTKIRAGSSSKSDGGVVVDAKAVHVHPKFTVGTHDYNVAVIETATPLKLDGKKMKAIKLATKEPSTGSSVLASGWGAINIHQDDPETLQSVTMAVYDRTKCVAEYKAANITITPRVMCAGGKDKTAYLGDDGSALVYKGEAVGIAAYEIVWGRDDLPGLFTNIADPEITKFIKEKAKL